MLFRPVVEGRVYGKTGNNFASPPFDYKASEGIRLFRSGRLYFKCSSA